MILVCMVCVVFMIYHLVDNYSADKESDWDKQSATNYIIAGSVAAHGNDAPDIV